MKVFFNPKALLPIKSKLPKTLPCNSLLLHKKHGHDLDLTYAVVVYSHHRDVKVALDDLKNAGCTTDDMILIAHNAKRYSWNHQLMINDYFDLKKFAFNHIAQEFFLRLFQKGKYLVLITGEKADVNAISKIMARRNGHAEAWNFESF